MGHILSGGAGLGFPLPPSLFPRLPQWGGGERVKKSILLLLLEEKGAIEDKMVGWHQQLKGPESEQSPGDGEGQGSLACCSPQDCRESDTTE